MLSKQTGMSKVVFDNRFHGYDSENTTKEELDYAPHFSEKSKVKECYVDIIMKIS